MNLGLKVDRKDPATGGLQSPEELAAQEAERERMLQESMQQEVVNIVLYKLEKTMDGFEDR